MKLEIDGKSGVPFYRQIIDQVQFAIANNSLATGDRLPTVRQLAVDLKINPNTVSRAYQELEIRGVLATQMGTGTFVAESKVEISALEQRRMLDQICTELLSRAANYGFTAREVFEAIRDRLEEARETT